MTSDLPTWIRELESDEPARQAAAAEAIAHLGEDARPAAVALVRALRSADESTRHWCAAALEDIGPPSTEQIPELISLARHASGDPAYWVVTLLGRAAGEAAPAVDALAGVLRDSPERTVRERAAWALGRIGPAARAAAPVLRDAAASDQPRLARLSRQALEAIGG